MIEINNVALEEEAFQALRDVRRTVFCQEQGVSEADEFDAHEGASRHFLATYLGQPAGAARWRLTEKGAKLERFAVLAPYRNKGVGSALVKAVLDDLDAQPDPPAYLYMHAQITAVGLYERFGFVKEGEEFVECDIRHYLMHKRRG